MPTVIILYDSRGGNTRAVAEALADGAALVPKVACTLMPARELDLAALADAQALALGSPNYFTYMSGCLKTFFDEAHGNAAFKGKPFVAFSTHGGGGGVAKIIERLATAIGMKKVAEGLDILNAPAGDQLRECRELGRAIARAAANA